MDVFDTSWNDLQKLVSTTSVINICRELYTTAVSLNYTVEIKVCRVLHICALSMPSGTTMVTTLFKTLQENERSYHSYTKWRHYDVLPVLAYTICCSLLIVCCRKLANRTLPNTD